MSSTARTRGFPARLFAVLIALAVAVPVGSALMQPSGAQAAGVGTESGTVNGTVFYDRNNNAYYEPTTFPAGGPDSGLEGIVIRAFDSDGALVSSTTSAANGTYTLNVTGARTRQLRIEFSFAATGALTGFTEALANEFGFNYTGQSFGAVRFVTMNATAVDYGLHRPSEYCLNNPQLVTCLQPGGAASGNGALVFSANRLGPTPGSLDSSGVVTDLTTIGAVFGIGIDPMPHRLRSSYRPGNAFMGTYVKRHSEYGSAGATNTIYHVTVPQNGAGTAREFIRLPGTLPAHDSTPAPNFGDVAYTGDFGIFAKVGRVGLGDVDVMDDATTILAVDMDEAAPKLYFIPIVEGAGGVLSAGAPASVAIPAPGTFGGVPCVGTWHPMGIGTRGNRILVGGVCGAETTVAPDKPNGPHPTQSAAFVLEYTGARDGTGSFATIFATSLGYERGCLYNVGCDHTTSTVGSLFSADWGAWNEYPNYRSDGAVANPQAMLANIEITDSGDLILGLRDRFADQVKAGSSAYSEAYLPGSVYPKPPLSDPDGHVGVYNFAGGDMLRVCNASGTLSLESGGTCNGGLSGSQYTDFSGSREFYYDNYPHAETGALHGETINGSTATLSGYDGVWVTAYDITRTDQQGVLSFGSCDDRVAAGNCWPTNSTEGYGSRIGGIPFTSSFAKGNGLADLEVLCDEVPVGVRSSLWRDLDGDGIRDAGEPAIAGVTVNLYDQNGTLVGSTITDANGVFVFTSYLGAFAHIDQGLVANQEGYTIRLDNPADYLEGGPLYGQYPTQTGATSSSLSNDEITDSDVVLANWSTGGGEVLWPTVTLAALAPGEHDSSYGFGFVESEPLVGLSGVLWVDVDGDGIRDEGEAPLAGVLITLYKADGVTPATLADGVTPATATTLADGSYFIDGLEAGDYRALFTLPDGYRFTTPTVGTDGTVDSDPVATADPLQGMTAVFSITDRPAGDTVADTDPSTTAWFVNPTIDAGVVPLVAMGDYVWIDTNGDGIQDAGEAPLAGVTVTLYNPDGTLARDANGVLVAPAVTDADGFYLIDNLLPGDYYATFRLPADYTFTVTGSGTSATDSNPSPSRDDPEFGITPVFTISATVSGDTIVDDDPNTIALFINPTIDAGVIPPMVSFSGTLWSDVDRDGVLDAGESPYAGLTLRLTDLDGNPVLDVFGRPVADVTTAADGTYRFDQLSVGTYLVTVVDPPEGMALTLPGATGTWRVELLTAGMHREGVDFPYAVPVPAPTEPEEVITTDSPISRLLRIPNSIPTGLGRSVQVPPEVMLALLALLSGLVLLVPIVAARRRRRSRATGSASEVAPDEDEAAGFLEGDIPRLPSLPPSPRSLSPGLFPAPEGARWVQDPTDEPPPLERPVTGLFADQRGPKAVSRPAPSAASPEEHEPVEITSPRALDVRLVVTNDSGTISAHLNISTAMKPPTARMVAAGAAGLLLLRALRLLWR